MSFQEFQNRLTSSQLLAHAQPRYGEYLGTMIENNCFGAEARITEFLKHLTDSILAGEINLIYPDAKTQIGRQNFRTLERHRKELTFRLQPGGALIAKYDRFFIQEPNET